MSDVTWDRGGTAELLALEGELLVVRSSIASAPGSTLAGTFQADPALAIAMKVRSCKRDGDRFRIDGRGVNFTRGARAMVESILSAKRGGG